MYGTPRKTLAKTLYKSSCLKYQRNATSPRSTPIIQFEWQVAQWSQDANFHHLKSCLVSGHKSVQSRAIYQKTQENQKHEIGKVLFDSMTKKEEEIPLMAAIEVPHQLDALPSTANMSAQNKTALVPHNKNHDLIPLQPNFEGHDDVTNMDLLSALCGINENTDGTINSVTTTVTNTCNTSNFFTMPNSMLANCNVGTINVTISFSTLLHKL